jgi:hypothetical protein
MMSAFTVRLESKVPSVCTLTLPDEAESESGCGKTLVEIIPPELLMVTYTSAELPLKFTGEILFMKSADTFTFTGPPPEGTVWVRWMMVSVLPVVPWIGTPCSGTTPMLGRVTDVPLPV